MLKNKNITIYIFVALFLIILSVVVFIYFNINEKATIDKGTTPVLIGTKYYIIPLYYTTDRSRTNVKDVNNFYGNVYSDNLEVGKIEVSIPFNHSYGDIELPSWWDILDNNNPKKFFTIKKINPLQKKVFYNSLLNDIKQSDEEDVLLFIHGYNNSFSDAALRAAQITFDLGFKGASILYSWPSNGNSQNYISDTENVKLTKYHLKVFLKSIIDKTKPKKFNIIAHSLGNRALTDALRDIAVENKSVKFNHVILAAPDINSKIFKQDIAPYIQNTANRFTIYISTNDRALLASQKIHHFSRVGNSKENYSGFETIDISNINCDDIFYHGCFAEARPVLMDIYQLLKNDSDPINRNLININKIWTIRND